MLGRKLQPAGGSHAGQRDVRHNSRKPVMPQPFLHHCQSVLVAAAVGIDQPVWGKPGLGKSGSEQIPAGPYPKHHPTALTGTSGKAGPEQGRCGIIAEIGV